MLRLKATKSRRELYIWADSWGVELISYDDIWFNIVGDRAATVNDRHEKVYGNVASIAYQWPGFVHRFMRINYNKINYSKLSYIFGKFGMYTS